MRSGSWLRCAVAACAVWVSIHGGPACAQDGAHDSPEYRRLIRRAVGAFDRGQWAQARGLFERAHEVNPNARTLRGAGMSAFELGDYREAIRLLRASLAESRRALEPEQRADAESLVERARGLVGAYSVRIAPADAQLFVDGIEAQLDERGRVILDIGEHTMSARLDGYLPAERTLRVHGGENESIALDLDPEPPASRGLVISDSAIALFVGAGASLLAGVVAYAWTADRVGEVDACANPPMGLVCANRASLEVQRDAAIGMSVVTSVGWLGLAVAGGIVLFIDNEHDD